MKEELWIKPDGQYVISQQVRFCVPNSSGYHTKKLWTETGNWIIAGNSIRLIPAEAAPDKRFDLFRKLLVKKQGEETGLIYDGPEKKLKAYVLLKKTEPNQAPTTSEKNES